MATGAAHDPGPRLGIGRWALQSQSEQQLLAMLGGLHAARKLLKLFPARCQAAQGAVQRVTLAAQLRNRLLGCTACEASALEPAQVAHRCTQVAVLTQAHLMDGEAACPCRSVHAACARALLPQQLHPLESLMQPGCAPAPAARLGLRAARGAAPVNMPMKAASEVANSCRLSCSASPRSSGPSRALLAAGTAAWLTLSLMCTKSCSAVLQICAWESSSCAPHTPQAAGNRAPAGWR